ncbi:MAG: hypothetical protein JXA37_01585 [Chloroflexia bacterium]|nr:hypothetical protein [Chloroflexia bacterium]
MSEDTKYTLQEFHQKMAAGLFNKVWDYLDQTERSAEDADDMVHTAHASRYHWGQVGTPLELERGEWQISRVYAVLGRPEPALYHARRCLQRCQEHGLGDFDLAFAYEALARAHAVAGHPAEREKYLQLARGAGEQIGDKGNREYFFSELEGIPAL